MTTAWISRHVMLSSGRMEDVIVNRGVAYEAAFLTAHDTPCYLEINCEFERKTPPNYENGGTNQSKKRVK